MNTNTSKKTLQTILAAAAIGLTASASQAQFGARLGGPIVVADYSYGGYGAGFNGGGYYGGGFNGFGNAGFSNSGMYTGTDQFTTPNDVVVGGQLLGNQPLSNFQQPRNILVPTQNGFARTFVDPINRGTSFDIGTGVNQVNPAAAAAAGINPNAGSVVLPNRFLLGSNAAAARVSLMNTGTVLPNIRTGVGTGSSFGIGTGVNQVNPAAAAAAGINPNSGSVVIPNRFPLSGFGGSTSYNIGFGVGQINPAAAAAAGISPTATSVTLPNRSRLGGFNTGAFAPVVPGPVTTGVSGASFFGLRAR